MLLLHHLKHPKSSLFPSQFRPFLNYLKPRNFISESDRICYTLSLNHLHRALFQTQKYLQSIYLFKLSPLSPPQQDPYDFPSLLRSCAYLPLLDLSSVLHGYLMKLGHINWFNISATLSKTYLKLGDKNASFQVFDEMPLKNQDFCNSAVCSFGSGGYFTLVLDVFELIVNSGFSPSLESVRFAIMACGELRSLDKGLWVHNFVTENKYNHDLVIGNSLISMYVRTERLDLARRTFDTMLNKDVVTWNSIISGYSQSKNSAETFNLFQLMKKAENISPNEVTFLGLILASGDTINLDQGKSLHGHCIKTALMSKPRLGTAIVGMYTKCNSIDLAEAAFNESSFQRSLVSWNSLIFGYSQNCYYKKAVRVFKDMISSCLKPDLVTFSNVLQSYSALGNLGAIQTVHSLIIKKGFEVEDDIVLATSILDAYGKCSGSCSALSLFITIKNPNVAMWNVLLGAFLKDHQPELGLLYFLEMIRTEISPDAVTVLAVLQLCGEFGIMKQANMVHSYSLSRGYSSHLDVENAVMDMYIKCGGIKDAEKVFNLADLRNVVLWNTMLSGVEKKDAVKLFTEMLSESEIRPNVVTILTLIQVFTTGVFMVHPFVIKLGVESDTPVMNKLIDGYAKNGMIDDGYLLFLQMGRFRDRCSWNVMISGYGMNSHGFKACQLFTQMEEEEEEEPDSVTFICVLSACSHSGLIKEGCRFFDLMVNKYKIEPSYEHWTCVIDLFGRAGRLEEAYELVKNGVEQKMKGEAIWGALLDGCRMNGELEIGELVGEKMLENGVMDSGYHTLLSNFYASSSNWDGVDKVRRVFEDRLIKKPGISLILT